MKFQNPSLNSVLNGRTDKQTNGRTHKPKPICSPLFQSWGHKNCMMLHCNNAEMTIIYCHFCIFTVIIVISAFLQCKIIQFLLFIF